MGAFLRLRDRDADDVEQEDHDLQDRGTDRAEIHITNRAAELVGEHDQHEEGGISCVIVPDAAITPVASRIS
jgi:hypothetical protein